MRLVLGLIALVVVAGVAVGSAEATVVWGCTPANFFTGSNVPGSIFVYNGSVATANVAVKFLRRDGVNLAGVQVPGAGIGVTYPGQTGVNTVAVAPGNTLIVNYTQGIPTDNTFSNDVPASIRIVSDQPIVVGFNNEFSGPHIGSCAILHP